MVTKHQQHRQIEVSLWILPPIPT